MLTSHVGVRIGTVTLPGATPQLLKGLSTGSATGKRIQWRSRSIAEYV
jgi:hypothetical protein